MKYIYQIAHTDGRRYIGQTADPRHRWATHLYDLRHGRHKSNELQAAYDGDSSSLTFEVICQCQDDAANELERFYIGKYRTTESAYGFNTSAGATERGGNEVSDATRRKLSAAKMGNTAMVGKRLSDQWRANLSAAQPHKRKVQCVDTGEVFDSFADAARKTGLNRTKIVSVCTGKRKTTGGMRFRYAD